MPAKFLYTHKELGQRTPEWLEIRKSVVGGSDVATILGLMDKYGTSKKLWKQQTGRLAEKVENDAMRRGSEMEDEAKIAIIKHLKKIEGIKSPKIPPFFAKHPKFPYVGVSFDGVDIKNKYIVEIKCPQYSWNFKSVFENGIQDYYYPQVQLQLAVANATWGIKKAYFCSYFPDGAYILDHFTYIEHLKTLAVIDIEYDPKYFAEMLKVIKIYRDFIDKDYYDAKIIGEAVKEFKKYEY